MPRPNQGGRATRPGGRRPRESRRTDPLVDRDVTAPPHEHRIEEDSDGSGREAIPAEVPEYADGDAPAGANGDPSLKVTCARVIDNKSSSRMTCTLHQRRKAGARAISKTSCAI